jgi:subtilisin family serine protease
LDQLCDRKRIHIREGGRMTRRHRIAAGIAFAFAGLSTAAAAPADGTPQRWIVTFDAPPLAAHDGSDIVRDAQGKRLAPPERRGARIDLDGPQARAYRSHLDATQAAFLDALRAGGKSGAAPLARWSVVANGMLLELDDAGAAAARALPGVRAVEPEFTRRVATDAGPGWVGAEPFWNDAVPGASGLGRGAGAIVGVIDTGINAAHPSFAATAEDGYLHVNPRGSFLGLCASTPPRCNAKLIGIHDFTSEGSRDGSDANGHGSHVAGTAAGNPWTAPASALTANQPLRVSGVAPRAAIVSYKACTNDPDDPTSPGTCSGSALVSSIEQAVRDGVDVINYSIGSEDARDPWSGVRGGGTTDALALLNARAAGVVAVVAAGNSGPREASINAPGNAPWVLTAAASTHDRIFGTVLAGVQGTGIAAPFSLAGAAQGAALPQRRIVHAKDFGNALCGTGPSEGVSPTGASNPFRPGTFNGEIVVCVRGIYARVEKSWNVRQAGAAGYVLVNTLAEAESIVSDNHGMPAVHLGYAAGQRLQAALEAARLAGGQVSASIEATRRVLDAELGDRRAAFSSRGPVRPYGGWLKPDIAAPGVSILAADNEQPVLAPLSGTSMATPHVAGAAALLAAARPNWNVSQIESALLTTARGGMRREDAATPASPHDVGGGRLRVDEAARAGLYFELPRSAFVAGDPVAGGDPEAPTRINRPSLVDASCAERCSFTRRVTDMGAGGSWTIEARLPAGAGASISPQAFALGPGQSQEIRVELDVADGRVVGGWVHGEIALRAASGVEQRLPVSVFSEPGSLPARLDAVAAATSGAAEFPLSGLVALPDAVFRGTALARQESAQQSVAGRGGRDTYDETAIGSVVRTLTIGGSDAGRSTFAIVAEASSASSRDVDLFIGQDQDGDGAPDAFEELCAADGPTANERCALDVVLEGAADRRTYWIYAINLTAGAGGSDAVALRWSAVPVVLPAGVAANDTLVASGPGRVAARAGFNVRVGWHAPSMLPGETWAGYLELGASREAPRGLGRVPVFVTASASLAQSAIVLDPRGDAVRLRLRPGAAHERIAVDLPANVAGLVVDLGNAANVDLHVARDATPGTGPELRAAPPRTTAAGSATGAAASKRVQIVAPALAPGRWYLTPTNTGAGDAEVVLSVSATFAGDAPALADNAYFNPDRSGHGVLLVRAGDQLAATWFTYREDGAPTWYIAQAPAPAAGRGTWQATLRRSTWNGASNQLSEVGEVILARTGTNAFRWTWQLDGRYGSEPMVAATVPECVEGGTRDYGGAWFAPARGGFGYSIVTLPSTEVQTAFLYDAAGNPTWLYGQVFPFGTGAFPLLQYSGFCPLCAATAPTTRPAGTLVRSYASAATGSIRVDATLLAPLAGAWVTDDAVQRISLERNCLR